MTSWPLLYIKTADNCNNSYFFSMLESVSGYERCSLYINMVMRLLGADNLTIVVEGFDLPYLTKVGRS